MVSERISGYRVLGDPAVKAEFTAAHCARLAQWFSPEGAFVHFGTPPSTRERLWNCFSLLEGNTAETRALAEAIIRATPIDHNHFEPFAAVELYLRYRDRLAPGVGEYLLEMVEAHLINTLEVRFGGEGAHNFSCMGTWYLLAAGQVLDRYAFNHPLASIPEVYCSQRIHAMGMNALRLLAYHTEHEAVFHEWNSPTYTPISLHCLAKIVELIDDPAAKAMALQIEMKLWREVLAMAHPGLGVSCGPFSRSYRVDLLGHASQMRILFCYLGITPDHSLVDVLDETRPGVVLHHDGDVPFVWSGPAWQLANRYHVPEEALAELAARQYPHRFTAPIHWSPFGYIDRENARYISVQGDVVPGGEAEVVQTQGPDWSLGYRSASTYSHSFPFFFDYAAKPQPQTMEDVRHLIGGIVFHGAPTEWVPDQQGQMVEADNFNNAGPVMVEETADGLAFTAGLFPSFAPLPADELSLNTMIGLHFAPLTATLNGQSWIGEPLEITGADAICRIEDAGVTYEIAYHFPHPVTLTLSRWAHFLRFAGFWYQGEKTAHGEAFLQGCTASGTFRVI
ncbi:MAG: hypothetical protein ACYDBB_25530 [Armatimonadota bacterium]